MIFQVIECLGDSLTFGARTYENYPLLLACYLNEHTQYRWHVTNRGVNGSTARDLWFRVVNDARHVHDREPAIVLIGTNDCKVQTPPSSYRRYLRQLVDVLQIYGWTVLLGEIPLIVAAGRLPYTTESMGHALRLNDVVREVGQVQQVRVVPLELVAEDLCDGIHTNDAGNRKIAETFGQVILTL